MVGAAAVLPKQGSTILSTLLVHPSVTNVSAFARRQLQVKDDHARQRPIINTNPSRWPDRFHNVEPKPEILFSALGTTRAQAGSFENQRKIDCDLNVELARAAKEAGVTVYVLISVNGIRSSWMFPYSRMKSELEAAIADIGFEKTVFVRRGSIVGTRKDSRFPEYAIQLLASFMGRISGNYLKDFWAQDAHIIGRAAVSAGLRCLEGSAPGDGVWIVDMGDVLRLGKTEWTLRSGDRPV